jgi:hypothetical protein
MIDRRFPALVLLFLAGGVYAGIALPARRAAGQAEADLARVRAEGEPIRRRVAEGEPQRAVEDAWRQAGRRTDGSVAGLRRVLLQSVADVPVTGVHLSVAAAQPPLAARTRFAALGSFSQLVGLAERLVGPRTGVVPGRLRWALRGSELAFELDGVVLAGAP